MSETTRMYHGTSMGNARKILKYGFSDEKNTIWNVSNPEMVYLAEEQEPEECDDDFDSYITDSKLTAIEAGQIAAAWFNSKSSDTVVFEFEVSEDTIGLFEDDDSCENTYGCCQINALELNDLISKGQIKVKMHTLHGSYIPYLRVFYLNSLSKSYLQYIHDTMLIKAMDAVGSTYIDDLHGCYDSLKTKVIPAEKFASRRRVAGNEDVADIIAAAS